MNDSLISVIVPVYNTENLLSRCVDSILSQTHKNLELILVDDGSTDGSGTIIDRYAAADARVLAFHKENGGQGTARNLALENAHGDFYAFIDSDDYVECDMLEKMLSAIIENDADLSVCGLSTLTAGRLTAPTTYSSPHIYENASELLYDYVTTLNIFTGMCNKLYKRELFDGLRFPSIRANEDAYILHEVLGRVKRAVHIGGGYYVQYVRPDSTEQSRYKPQRIALVDSATRLIDYITENFPQLYPYVAYKRVNDTAALLRKIIIDFVYLKNKSDFKRLRLALREECRRIARENPDVGGISRCAKMARGSAPVFFLYSYMYAFAKKCRSVLRAILYAFGKRS